MTYMFEQKVSNNGATNTEQVTVNELDDEKKETRGRKKSERVIVRVTLPEDVLIMIKEEAELDCSDVPTVIRRYLTRKYRGQ